MKKHNQKGNKRAKYLARKQKKQRAQAGRKQYFENIMEAWQNLIATAAYDLIEGVAPSEIAAEVQEYFDIEDAEERNQNIGNFCLAIKDTIEDCDPRLRDHEDKVLKEKVESAILELEKLLKEQQC